MFPLTIQFSHALQKHEYSGCKLEHKVHLHHPKNECSFFHYQINYNTIDFSSTFSINEISLVEEKVITQENKKESSSFFYKSSRAPPFSLFLS
ncbi:MAG: hypothetical protein QM495_11155 [Lutibacter sp.]|uniref:hypothetical protein n=1 Tax=Lutibacter sp. TaxID=1925666 RepID=UPI00385B5732